MTTQQPYDFKKLPDSKDEPSFDIGEANIEWQGKRLTSKIVFFNSGLMTANYIKPADGSPEGGTDNDVFLVSLLAKTQYNFQQFYERGVTDHHFGWALKYENKLHYPRTGSTTGTFSTGYRSIDATIEMISESGDVAKITFKAQKRLE
ncbi:hypothetical protein [Pseudomonas sp. GW456-12-1-14-TSB6]|uniref:hypothetical protein n=1 Tax=Pseudomonas sp. GW456-12-1-14-TSB6 TaxID=2751350 RepID=UPI000CD2704A|nr:hypothetical protein [Pseudomonas sp. GW456-12-1-14-TSB6]POA39133.1 hypothetical protein C1891_06780 [Pseudomonas sp. GW456-12-1-14-TSB6]